MPYTINKYSGAQVAVVADGTIDSTLDIKLIGKNYAGYGEIQNENAVFMLENFSNNTPPPRPLSGQIWYDSGTSKLKFYDGSKFRTAGGSEAGTVAPTGLTVGDFWFDTSNKQLYTWDGTTFILIGPQGIAGAGTTQMRSRNVRDISGINHPIIEAVADNATIFVVSPDGQFTLDNATNAIPGFTKIHQGVTLIYTATDETLGQTTSQHRFWGTATNSERLAGLPVTSFVQANSAAFSTFVQFADVGFTVGDPVAKLRIFNDAAITPTIQNQTSDTIVFQTTVSSATRTPMKLVGDNILPGLTATSNIGSPTVLFNTVYANTFSGTATRSDQLNLGGTYVTASAASSPNTIVARDADSDITARQFKGTATAAFYADLAEKYLADEDYEVGTVVMVGGEKEVTQCQANKFVIGVVSGNPAFKMNAGLVGGTYIALKGRVPVKVVGPVTKGDRIAAWENGSAIVVSQSMSLAFAVALESSDDAGIKNIECIVL
jgi:hypothetical protein